MAASGCSSKTGPKYLRYSVGTEPETLDPRKSTGIPEATVEAQLFEGLTTLDPKTIRFRQWPKMGNQSGWPEI